MKKLIGILLSAALLCSLLAGCTVEVQEEKKEVGNKFYFYYMNADASTLLREEFVPEEESAEFMLKELMQRLNRKAMEGERINLLPEEVEINSYTIADSALVIDFNGNYSKMSRAREILVRAGVVKTFSQVPGIASLEFTVNGRPLLDSREQPVGKMTNASFAEFGGSDSDSYTTETFTLYFTDKKGKKLVEEQRTVHYKRTIPRERVILEQLMKGPMEKGHYPTVPENTGVLDVVTSDGICYVKLDSVFSAYALDVSDKIPIYSVVNSLLASVKADRVQITVGDNKEGTFGEKMPLYHFYEKNEELTANKKEK